MEIPCKPFYNKRFVVIVNVSVRDYLQQIGSQQPIFPILSGSYNMLTEFMSENTPESNQDSGSDTNSENKNLSEKYSDVMGKINETLGNVDWTQMGKYGKAAGIIAVVVLAQIIIKVVIDTINFFPIIPGLLELLGVIVVGQWSWQNLRTSENRDAVLDKLQNLKKTYLG
tara:strand:- start:345 stop:854 length:510 start_codon:yes stop_codon:yes gene_type:complete